MKVDFYANVFGWLFFGLLLTFGSGIVVMSSQSLLNLIFGGMGYLFLFIAQIVLCIVLSVRINKMKPTTAKIIYSLYAILTGVTFSSIFLLFETSSLVFIFLVTAIIFGAFALFGKITKMDLSKWGIYLFMALLAIIILEIVNIFVMNNTLDMAACIIGIIVFLGYVAYDMQNIKRLKENGLTSDNMAIIGAFNLYLDFINLFIKLLQLFGKERD